MQYRRFGRTNWDISALSLGTMRCLDSAQVFQSTLQQALALGINHLETAPSYGQSETFLGLALQQLAPQIQQSSISLYITTKLLPQGDAATVERTIAQSCHRLGREVLDGVAIHGLNTPEHLEWVLHSPGMQALHQAHQQGRIRHLGFSTHGALELILAAIATGQFSFINLHYNYFFQRNAAAIAAAAAQDMGIFIISPADKGGRLHQPSPQLTQLCAPLSPLEFAHHWLLQDPRITTLSVGPATPQELDWLKAMLSSSTAPTDPPAIAAIQAQLTASQHHQLGLEQCHQCYACLPCPEAIQIPEVLRLRNLAVGLGMETYGQYRYGMFEQAGHWFPGRLASRCTDCGDCLPRCPHHLPIPTLLRETHQRLQGSKRRRLWDSDSSSTISPTGSR